MATPALIIAGITLPKECALDLAQSLSPIGGSTRRRMSSGALFSMTRWRRWKMTLSGGGFVPAPLLGINYDQPYEVHCIQPVSFRLGEALPAGWRARSDVPEFQVTGRDGIVTRLVYPILTVMSDPPEIIPGGNPTWKLDCEEA